MMKAEDGTVDRLKRVDPMKFRADHQGNVSTIWHAVLPDGATFDDAREPKNWAAVATRQAVQKGDLVAIWLADGSGMAEARIFAFDNSGITMRIGKLIPMADADQGYAQDAQHRVEPRAGAYVVINKRNGRIVGDISYGTPGAAASAMHALTARKSVAA